MRRALAFAISLVVGAAVWTGAVPRRVQASGMTWTAETSGTSQVLYDVAYHGGTYVAVGASGVILTSPDGASWQAQTSNTTVVLNSVTYGAAEWVAVGHGGVADVSTNATAWTASQIDPLAGIFEEVVYASGTYFATGWGFIFTSPDAASWTAHTWGGGQAIYGAAYTTAGGGTVVGVGQAVVTAAASAPGTWTLQSASLPTLYNVVDAGGVLVAVGQHGAVYTSSDGGATWSDHSIAQAQDVNLYDVAYDAACGFLVAVGQDGAVYSSTDGATWTAESSGTSASLYGVQVGGGQFVAVGAGGVILTSPSPCAAAGGPDLKLTKTRLGPAVAGQPVSYQLVVSNVGTAPMTGWIGVNDATPAGLASVSVSAAPPWSCTVTGSAISCTYNGGPGFSLAPGQSLPAVTVTGTVVAGTATLENCARLTAEHLSQDADPTNNAGCDKADVRAGEGGGQGQTALLCAVKFLDADGDGVQDATEPGLPNWTFTLYDSAGHPLGSGQTGPKGRICKQVKPGTYTVGETVQPGWVQTAPQPVPPGTATVSLAPGQTVILAFGNRPSKEPCCLDFRFVAGRADAYATGDGPEPSTPPPGQAAGAFDQTQPNQALWQRFTLPQGDCLTAAQVVLRVRPLAVPDSVNDRVYLYAGSSSWVANLGTGSGNPGGAALSGSPWDAGHQPSGQVLVLDLSALPTPAGTQNLLFALDAARVLDGAVQDDTEVDAIELDLTFCQCAPGEEPNASLTSGAREVRMTVGQPLILSDGLDRPLDVPPVIRDGRTFVPLRALAESMGFAVSWDPGERKATIASSDRTVEVWVGRSTALVVDTQAVFAEGGAPPSGPREETLAIDPQNPSVMPFIEGGRVMVPLRFVAEAMGFEVGFDPQDKSIHVACQYPYCLVPPLP
ncbi:MAG: hypothetical protein IRZ11_06895 [Clostridia bacterium]|nr:hypothetical protein [Clostridia bacterium]